MYEGLNILSATALNHYTISFPPLKLGSLPLNKISCNALECIIALFFLAIDVTITFASIFVRDCQVWKMCIPSITL